MPDILTVMVCLLFTLEESQGKCLVYGNLKKMVIFKRHKVGHERDRTALKFRYYRIVLVCSISVNIFV
jgi:hypothetical protein